MSSGQANGGVRNHAAAFAAVMSVAAPLAPPVSPIAASENVADFIDACDTALSIGLPASGGLLPGVDTADEAAMLKAYLLFLVNESLTMSSEAINGERVAAWHGRLAPRVWHLLGFPREPSLLTVQLTFSLLGDYEHLAAEMRALVWTVGDFAASGLMPGLRS